MSGSDTTRPMGFHNDECARNRNQLVANINNIIVPV